MGNCYAVHMNCLSRVLTFALFGGLMLTLVQAPVARAQNDKDLDRLITSMYDDAKKFRSSFSPSISKSTIRKTSQEKQSKRLVDQFVSDVGAMRSQYRKKKTVDATFPEFKRPLCRLTTCFTACILTTQPMPRGPRSGQSSSRFPKPSTYHLR